MSTFTAIDLFSGCGGLTLGLKQAGFRVLAAVDSDPLSMETYQLNHPDVKAWLNDIRQVSCGEVLESLGLEPGELDLLAGCPPCQGFSKIRTLNGKREVKDSRNDLIFEFLRFVQKLAPKMVMLENVPGLAKDDLFFRFINQLEKAGYQKPTWDILDAADYGVPQRRKRLILLTSKTEKPVLAEPVKKRVTVREAIGRLPEPSSAQDPLHNYPVNRSSKVLRLIRRIPRNGGSRSDLPNEMQLPCHKKTDGFKDVYGRMSWDDVAPTITSGCINPSKGRFLHPDQDRAITLREAALLQSFPARYRFSLRRGMYPAAQMIGNALPPSFIAAHAARIKTFMAVC